MNDDLAEFFAEAETLLQAIAHQDLHGRPVYVVSTSRAPPDLSDLASCDAFTARNLDLHLQPALGGQWRGRGAAMVISDAVAARRPPALRREFVLGRALHEMAHCIDLDFLDDLDDPDDEPDDEALAVARVSVADNIARPCTREYYEVQLRCFHNSSFQRCALHLHSRSARLGLHIPLCLVLPSGGRMPFIPESWQAALRGELERTVGMPIATILQTEPPPEFQAIEADANRMLRDYRPRLAAKPKRKPAMNILDKITSVFRKRERTAIEGFDQLVRAVADGGGKTDPERAAAILDDADKSPQDLEAAVQLIVRRRELRKQLDTGVKAQAELDQIDAQSSQLERERERLIESFNEKHFAPLRSRIPPLESAMRQGKLAEQELISTAVHAENQVQRIDTREPSRRISELRERLTDLERRLHAAGGWTPEKRLAREGMTEFGQAFIGAPPDESALAKLRDERDALKGELERIEGEIAVNNRQVEAADRQRRGSALSVV